MGVAAIQGRCGNRFRFAAYLGLQALKAVRAGTSLRLGQYFAGERILTVDAPVAQNGDVEQVRVCTPSKAERFFSPIGARVSRYQICAASEGNLVSGFRQPYSSNTVSPSVSKRKPPPYCQSTAFDMPPCPSSTAFGSCGFGHARRFPRQYNGDSPCGPQRQCRQDPKTSRVPSRQFTTRFAVSLTATFLVAELRERYPLGMAVKLAPSRCR